MTIIWCMTPEIWSVTDNIFCHFELFLALLTPLTTWKIKILKNWKKAPGDIIILHKCTENHDHMLYCSWDMAHDRCHYFSFWALFCPFNSLKNQNLKKRKKHLEISTFYTSVLKIMIICCTEIKRVADVTQIPKSSWPNIMKMWNAAIPNTCINFVTKR